MDDKFTDIFCQNMIDELNEYPTLEPQNHDIRQCYEAIKSRNARIAELEAKQRWVKVSDKIPDDDDDILGVTKKGIVMEGSFWMKNDTMPCMLTGYGAFSITHWMPLPEPPDMLK